jgi:hypothetical protein
LRLRSVPWIEDELQAWMHELETRLLHPNPGRGGWPAARPRPRRPLPLPTAAGW